MSEMQVLRQMEATSYMVKVEFIEDGEVTTFTQFFGSKAQAVVFAREQFDRFDETSALTITMRQANLPVVDHNGQPINIR